MEPRAQGDRLPSPPGTVHPHGIIRPRRGRRAALRSTPDLTDPNAAHDPVRARSRGRQRLLGELVQRRGASAGARLRRRCTRGPGRPGARRVAGGPRPDDPSGAAPPARLRRGHCQYRRRSPGRRTAAGSCAPARPHALPRPACRDRGVFPHHRQGRGRAVPERGDRHRLRGRPQTPLRRRGAAGLGAAPAVPLRGAHVVEAALRRPCARRGGDGDVLGAPPTGPGDRRALV